MSSLRLPSSSSSSSLFDTIGLPRSKTTSRPSSTVNCSSRKQPHIPKLEPFSRSKFDRGVKEPPFIQKTENDLADYCSTLEGDEAYSCWKAYFELKDLENELPKEDLRRLVIQSGGVKSLVDYVHGVSTINKQKNEHISESAKASNGMKQDHKPFPIPDGLPKTEEEIEEEEKAKMPDSAFTRLLRAKGKFPAWYSQRPDHETD